MRGAVGEGNRAGGRGRRSGRIRIGNERTCAAERDKAVGCSEVCNRVLLAGAAALQSEVVVVVSVAVGKVFRVIRGIPERVHFESDAIVDSAVADATAAFAQDGKARTSFRAACDGVLCKWRGAS